MKSKLCILISIPLVWILDRLPNRRLLNHEIVAKLLFERFMADADILGIVREKPDLTNWESGPIDRSTFTLMGA